MLAAEFPAFDKNFLFSRASNQHSAVPLAVDTGYKFFRA